MNEQKLEQMEKYTRFALQRIGEYSKIGGVEDFRLEEELYAFGIGETKVSKYAILGFLRSSGLIRTEFPTAFWRNRGIYVTFHTITKEGVVELLESEKQKNNEVALYGKPLDGDEPLITDKLDREIYSQ